MKLSKKCQYALRAVLELAARSDQAPVKIQAVAEAQAIPHRFLEVILNELRHGGIVASRRGNDGGYILAGPPASFTVAAVIGQIEGCVSISPQFTDDGDGPRGAFGDGAFRRLWAQVDQAILEVCEGTTFAELLSYEQESRAGAAPNYCI